MAAQKVSRADMHCHSTASAVSKLGVQRALGLPECATPPEQVYELAKRRGMDFVTITDHDTIAGVLELADLPDVFISEELTANFRGEPQAVHVLCYGITPDQHEWLMRNNGDVELCAAYLHEHEVTCALAHPFYAVAAPLGARHRRRLAQLFPIWETRNGSRARELNMPAAVYIETHGGIGIGGSDDHAGTDIGRTFTETPAARAPREFLRSIRAGAADACGGQGSAAKWAHAAMALTARAVGRGAGSAVPDPRTVLAIAERVMREGDVRRGAARGDLSAEDARDLLRAWLDATELGLSESEFIAYLQDDEFSHTDLFRRARCIHERKLRGAVAKATEAAARGDYVAALEGIFAACLSAVPYAPAAAFLGREKAKLVARDGEPRRIALVADAVGGMHGVTHTIDEIRERGVPGFEVEVVGTDPRVDRRLPAVAEVDIPFYSGLRVGVPSVPALVETLAEGRYDLVHLCAPGPVGIAAALAARMMQMPLVGSYHTELAAYAGMRSGDPRLQAAVSRALSIFYGSCDVVLSPSAQSDRSLGALGIDAEQIGRWDRGVDLGRFNPDRRIAGLLPGEVNVLYCGRLTKEKGADLLAEAFLAARERDPRLHLVLAGGGPEQHRLRERLEREATFLGWLEGTELAEVYASADLFLFASRTDTFGQVLLEAQASGLPVVAVAEGGPASLIEDGVSGLLRPPDAKALADAVVSVSLAPALAERLTLGGREAVRTRSWERALRQLGAGYHRALGVHPGAAIGIAA